MLKNIRIAALLTIGLALIALSLPARAQPSDNLTLGALITNTARVPGTVSAIAPRNTGGKGAICTFNQASEIGNPSIAFSIQFEDSASGLWQALVTSGAITAPNTPTSVIVYPGAVATSVPTGAVIAGLKLPVIWRVTQVITGGTSTTGTIGCDLLN